MWCWWVGGNIGCEIGEQFADRIIRSASKKFLNRLATNKSCLNNLWNRSARRKHISYDEKAKGRHLLSKSESYHVEEHSMQLYQWQLWKSNSIPQEVSSDQFADQVFCLSMNHRVTRGAMNVCKTWGTRSNDKRVSRKPWKSNTS